MADAIRYAELFAAGIAAGAMNAIAGGGGFVTLPVLMHVGLPSTLANSTGTVAMFPASLASAAELGRKSFKSLRGASLRSLLWVSFAGGLAGALLLLVTPSDTFDLILPWLLLCATVALLFGGRLAKPNGGKGVGAMPLLGAQFILGAYGGYFGGAVGLMVMAVWLVLDGADMKDLTPSRILTVAAANAVAVLVFLASGNWRWRAAIPMMVGGVLGGWLGALFDKKLPDWLITWSVRVFAVFVTAGYFWKAYT